MVVLVAYICKRSTTEERLRQKPINLWPHNEGKGPRGLPRRQRPRMPSLHCPNGRRTTAVRAQGARVAGRPAPAGRRAPRAERPKSVRTLFVLLNDHAFRQPSSPSISMPKNALASSLIIRVFSTSSSWHCSAMARPHRSADNVKHDDCERDNVLHGVRLEREHPVCSKRRSLRMGTCHQF
jgi:hypothetical protein